MEFDLSKVCSSQAPFNVITSTNSDNNFQSTQQHQSFTNLIQEPCQSTPTAASQQPLAAKRTMQASALRSLLPDSVLASSHTSTSGSVTTKAAPTHPISVSSSCTLSKASEPCFPLTTSTHIVVTSNQNPAAAEETSLMRASNQNKESPLPNIGLTMRPIMRAVPAEPSATITTSSPLRRQRSVSDSSRPGLSDSSLLRLAEEAGLLTHDEQKLQQATGFPNSSSSSAASAHPIIPRLDTNLSHTSTCDDAQSTTNDKYLNDNQKPASTDLSTTKCTTTQPTTKPTTTQLFQQKVLPKPTSIPSFFPSIKGPSTGLCAMKRFPPMKNEQVSVTCGTRTPPKPKLLEPTPVVPTEHGEEVHYSSLSGASDGVAARNRRAQKAGSRRDEHVSPALVASSLETPPQSQLVVDLSSASPQRELHSTPRAGAPGIMRPKLDITLHLSSSDDEEPDNEQFPKFRAGRILETPSPLSSQHASKTLN